VGNPYELFRLLQVLSPFIIAGIFWLPVHHAKYKSVHGGGISKYNVTTEYFRWYELAFYVIHISHSTRTDLYMLARRPCPRKWNFKIKKIFAWAGLEPQSSWSLFSELLRL
jgi:hypothetical protein